MQRLNDKRTLIVDQSSKCCGFAVLDGPELVYHGHLSSVSKYSSLRLLEFHQDLRGIAFEFNIEEVVFELIGYQGLDGRAAIRLLLSAETICMAIADENGRPWYAVHPNTWKASVGVAGMESTAAKVENRRRMCQRWDLQDSEIKSLDHSDALGIAAHWVIMAEEERAKKKHG